MSNDKKFALVGGSNYSGGWRVYQSLFDAKRFVHLLTETGFKKENIIKLYSGKYTAPNILSELRKLAGKLTEPGAVGVVYFAGHGTQTRDHNHDEADGRDEALQTHDRRLVTDDQITACFTGIHPRAWLLTIADTCHSPSLDMCHGKDKQWISIKAALDHQSALQSGDGSCMSTQLFKLLQDGYHRSVSNLAADLDRALRQSFVGGLQTCKVEVSNENIWDQDLPI